MEIKNKITFVHLEDISKTLDIALSTETNLILYGPGGYGKTELVKAKIKEHKLSANTVVGYKNMPVEALLGLPDMQKLMDDSEYEIAFEKSVFKGAEVLVLEEFLDVLPETATALKDIMTEGGFRQKGKFIKSDIKTVIIITNTSPESLSNNDSLKAFYLDRFPIRKKVIWVSNNAAMYYKLFEVNTELSMLDMKKLAYICEKVKPSPRIAMVAAKFIATTGDIKNIAILTEFADIDVDSLSEDFNTRDELEQFTKKLRHILRLINTEPRNLSFQLYLQSKLNSIANEKLIKKREGVFQTLQGAIQQNINSIHLSLKIDVSQEIKNNIDETFRDFEYEPSPGV